jgi:predicted amidohydrolase YtcJ
MTGGEMIVKNGRLTGVLIDNAIDVVSAVIPADSEEDVNASLLEAQRKLFSQGLTTISDCGLGVKSVNKIQQMQDAGSLKLRFYVMLSDNKANYDFIAENGKIKTDRLNVRSFKIFGDGALGSRGACLLAPYSDQKGYYGFLLSTPEHFDSVANFLYANDLQMNTHAIGDSGNRTLLNIYGKYLQGENDRRWRIEHAQVIAPSDFELFGKYKIIPSVQPTHATTDMNWADERLGEERIKTAYAYKQLLNENGWLALGTDFPVEDTDPLKTFYAAVIRKDIYGMPENGFQTENALTREETLKGMTIWAAKANFEENEKGSLEAGKMADFVILEQDLMTAEENEILSIKVLSTFVNGERVFKQ